MKVMKKVAICVSAILMIVVGGGIAVFADYFEHATGALNRNLVAATPVSSEYVPAKSATETDGSAADIFSDKSNNQIRINLRIAAAAEMDASVVCLLPGYAEGSSVKDGSDWGNYPDKVCGLQQISLDDAGTAATILPLKEFENSDYTLAIFYDGGILTKTFNPVIQYPWGDVTDDGKVDVSDVIALRRIILKGTYTQKQLAAGDLAQDNQLTVADVIALRRLIIKGVNG